jgi:hypothetical protein
MQPALTNKGLLRYVDSWPSANWLVVGLSTRIPHPAHIKHLSLVYISPNQNNNKIAMHNEMPDYITMLRYARRTEIAARASLGV